MNKTIKCIGATILNRMGVVRRYAQHRSIRILMYHRVNNDPDCLGLTVSPEHFSLQLQYLKDNYKIISLRDAVTLISSGVITKDYCVITFDDGYRDNYQIAAPLLEVHSVPATIFVTYDAIETGHFGWGAFDRTILTTTAITLDLIGWKLGEYVLASQVARENAVISLHRKLKLLPDAKKKEIVDHVVAKYGGKGTVDRAMMKWEEVRDLASGRLVTIGAHTITHPILSRVPHDQARREVIEGKQMLEDNLLRTVDYFAYPNGQPEDIGKNGIALVKEAGYLAACTTISGQNVPGADIFALKRIDVTNSISTDAQRRFSPDLFAFSLSGLLNR